MHAFGMRKLRSGGGRLVALALASVVSTCGFGAFGAGSAIALGEQCSGANAVGVGGFLQQDAHLIWKEDFNSAPDPLACSGSQGSGGTPSVFYSPQSSGGGLNAWGAFDGIFHDKSAKFIGTDEPPEGPAKEEGTQLNRIASAIGSDVAVIPVTQTAISIVAHPPSLPAHPSCAVSRITGAEVEGVFSGQLTNWRQLKAASNRKAGGDCDQAITRIVREEDSGTTYQLKHYLDQIEPESLECTGKSPQTWDQLQPSTGGEASPNRDWPRPADCQEGEGPVTVVATSGEGAFGPLEFVVGNAGTITYAGLREAEFAAPKFILDVHNGVKAASPSNKENDANCAAAKYELPSGWESGVNIDWSQVYGSNPKIGEVAKNAYPICTLTWGIAATDHFGKGVATTVHDYLAFVVDKEGGQAILRHEGYHDLPGPIAKAAAVAISHINGEESEEEEKEEEEKEGGSGTVLCNTPPELEEGVLACPKGKGFSGKVTGGLMPKSVASFNSASGPEATVSCTEGFFAGEFNEDGTGIFGGISGFSFGAEESCTSSFPGEPTVNVAFENPPYYASRFVYTGSGAPQGFFELARKDEEPPLLRVQSSPIFGTLGCVYAPGALGFQVTNGSPTEMLMTGKWKLLEESPKKGVCPIGLTSTAFLSLGGSEELPFYIAGK